MAIWCDPLAELIDELQQAFPKQASALVDDVPPFEDVQLWAGATPWGRADDRARVEQDPPVQAVVAYFDRLAARRS
jgi:hypothetical protein